MGLLIRCLLGKAWPENLEIKVPGPTGRFSEEKSKSLGAWWAQLVDLRHPAIGFATAAGLAPDTVAEPDPDADRPVDLAGLRELTRSASGGPDPAPPPQKKSSRGAMRLQSPGR